MKFISVIGAGYVGLVTAACFAELGNKVTLIEIDPRKIRLLEQGIMPVHEQRLPEIWRRHRINGRLRLTSDYDQGLKDSEYVFICVGTPSTSNGKPDLRSVRSAAKSIAKAARGHIVVVSKSTVPVGTADLVHKIILRHKKHDLDFAVVSNPEFLREGCAVLDFLNPIRVVIGSSDVLAAQAVAQLYQSFDCPIIMCDAGTAELAKYASNAFLATRISFINEIALLCDKFGVNVVDVARVVGMEPRCGDGYLGAGLGWGGSCLPKDVRGLIHMSQSQGLDSSLLRSVLRVNVRQPKVAVRKLQTILGSLNGKTVGILGLAFKPNSDDMREASSLALIALLQEQGCRIKAYDPQAMDKAAELISHIICCADAYEVARDSEALVLVTEWDEFKQLDMKKLCSLMKYPVLIDGRNFYDPEEMVAAGFIYEGIGRNASSFGRELLPLLKDKMVTAQPLAVGGVGHKK
jgi:UDPglucose 6-dehydrogenase